MVVANRDAGLASSGRIHQSVTATRQNEGVARRRSARSSPTTQENQNRSLQRAMQCSDAVANATGRSTAQDSCEIWGVITARMGAQTAGIATPTVWLCRPGIGAGAEGALDSHVQARALAEASCVCVLRLQHVRTGWVDFAQQPNARRLPAAVSCLLHSQEVPETGWTVSATANSQKTALGNRPSISTPFDGGSHSNTTKGILPRSSR